MKPILQLDDNSITLRDNNRDLSCDEILSPEIQALIREMKEIMHNAPGVGLAAPQIGVNINLAVIEDDAERLKTVPDEILKDRNRKPVGFHVIINPVITQYEGEIKFFLKAA